MAKILLVEDDNNLREIYEARLQAEGYTIVSAVDGEEALVVAKKENPDLIISDVMMPRISGFEMLDILRNTDGLKNVKVIMLTALGQAEDKTRADSLGADRYLVKSQVTLEDIVKAAQELLGPADSAQPAAAEAPQPQVAPPVPAQTPVVAPMPVQAPPAAAPVSAPTPAYQPAPAPDSSVPAPAPQPMSTPAPVVQPQPAAPAMPQVPEPAMGVPAPPAPAEPASVPAPAPEAPPVPVGSAAPVPAVPSPVEPQPAEAPMPVMPPAEPAVPQTPPTPQPPAPTEPQAPAIPEPTPAAPPVMPPVPGDSADSTAAEEDLIKSQIESFVSQDQPNQQAAPAAAEPASPATPAPSVQPEPPEPPAAAPPQTPPENTGNDAMAKAIEDLVAETNQPASAPSSGTPAPAAPPAKDGLTQMPAPDVVAPQPQPAEAPAPQPEAPESSEGSADEDGVTVAHKKVIRPLSATAEATAKPGLDELMAREGVNLDDKPHVNEAVDSALAAAGMQASQHPPGHVIAPTPSTPGANPEVDPNSIAL